jgi:hypothetical protein
VGRLVKARLAIELDAVERKIIIDIHLPPNTTGVSSHYGGRRFVQNLG